MSKKRKLLFIITTLGGGGAERVTTYLMRYFSEDPQFDINLLLLKNSKNSYKDLPPNIRIFNLGLKSRIRFSSLKILKKVKEINPDICFVNMNGVNLQLSILIPLINRGIKFIARETNVLSSGISKFTFIYKFLYRTFYNNYDKIIVQSDDMKFDMINNFGINPKKIIKINNPIYSSLVERKATEDAEYEFHTSCKNLVCIGRLSHQKGYDILFNLLGRIKVDTPYHIYILGTGPLKDELIHLVSQNNLQNNITFLGFCQNPYSIISKVDGLLLSSRYEGFPNVLLEAGILGKPVFANNCPGGINEIVINGINGQSCNFMDINEFELMFNKFLTSQYSASKIKEITRSRYDSNIILPKYEDIFKSL